MWLALIGSPVSGSGGRIGVSTGRVPLAAWRLREAAVDGAEASPLRADLAAKGAELRLAELSILQNEASVGLEKAQRIPDLDTDAISLLDDIVRETLEDIAATPKS